MSQFFYTHEHLSFKLVTLQFEECARSIAIMNDLIDLTPQF